MWSELSVSDAVQTSEIINASSEYQIKESRLNSALQHLEDQPNAGRFTNAGTETSSVVPQGFSTESSTQWTGLVEGWNDAQARDDKDLQGGYWADNNAQYSVQGQVQDQGQANAMPVEPPADTPIVDDMDAEGPWGYGYDPDQMARFMLSSDKDFRVPTPQYLVAPDPILEGSEFNQGKEDETIDKEVGELLSKLEVRRNAYLDNHAQLNLDLDYFDFDEINMQAGLLQKPNNFLVLGKPGIGLTTFAQRFAQKMNLVYISPQSAAEFFNPTASPNPEGGAGGDAATDGANKPINSPMPPQPNPEGFPMKGFEDRFMFDLTCQRIQMLDVHHRGYILDGWPMIRSEEISIEEQLEMLALLPFQPDYIFFMQMEDRDLFERRQDQKLDPITMKVYVKKQYIQTAISSVDVRGLEDVESKMKQPLKSEVSLTAGSASMRGLLKASLSNVASSVQDLVIEDKETSPKEKPEVSEVADFAPLRSSIVGRLISRLEDHPDQIQRDFDKFRMAFPALQSFINGFDRTKVFELDAYWSPSIIFKNAMSIITALGLMPSFIPVEIFHPMDKVAKRRIGPEDAGEGEGEFSSDDEGCIPDPNDPDNMEEEFPIDWDAVIKEAVTRGRIDPRFRWHVSRWKNLCPVALKEGRSIVGKPELAYGMHDKVYFLSSQDAVVKFQFNPRQYLVSSMPTSPVKFFVVGHPLAGKTAFSRELAKVSGGVVIDMKKQIRKHLESLKQRILFKVRFDTTTAAKKSLDKENHEAWKRHERLRRQRVKKWIADYVRRKAAEEMNKALAAERECRMMKYRQMRYRSEYHKLSDDEPYKASPCSVRPLAFSWKKFVEDIRKGKDTWSVQEQLELAVELFNAGKLRYKVKGRPGVGSGPGKSRKKRRPGEEAGEFGEEELGEGEEPGEGVEDEELGEGVGEEEEPRPRKRKKRRRKKPYCKKPPKITEVAVITDDEQDSSPLFSDDDNEPDESLRMRYPEMCVELTEPIPHPPPICDQDERVQTLVRVKVDEKEKWIATLPSEIYEDILRMAIREAEKCFQQKFPYAHFSGGWIVENLILDVEKWRSLLRAPDLYPDQVFVLQDKSPNNVRIWNNLKHAFAAKNPQPVRKMSNRKKRLGENSLFQTEGEDYSYGYMDANYYLRNEEEEDETDQEKGATKLPKDNLCGRLEETPSIMRQIDADRRRHRSRTGLSEDDTDIDMDTEAKASALFYANLGPGNPYLMSGDTPCQPPVNPGPIEGQVPPDPLIPPECIKHWHSVASEQELGIVPRPNHKNVPFDMKMTLSLEAARRLVRCYEGEDHTAFDMFDKSGSRSRSRSKVGQNQNQGSEEEEVEGDEELDEETKAQLLGFTASNISKFPEEFDLGRKKKSGSKPSKTKVNFKLRSKSISVDDLLEEDGNDMEVKTPSGMNTPKPVDIGPGPSPLTCDPEDEACLDQLALAKSQAPAVKEPVSIKKHFQKQIQQFNDFWNMVYPVISKAKVKSWEVGVFSYGDEKGPLQKAKGLWDELEARFALPPKIVTSAELADDEADVKESLALWADGGKSKDKRKDSEFKGEGEEEDEEDEDVQSQFDDEDEGEGADGDFDGYAGGAKALLMSLIFKPDAYRKALADIEEKRLFGSHHYYCPVTLYETRQIRKGASKYALRFQDRLYTFVSAEARAKFMDNPRKYLPKSATDRCIPPPRICITGAPGCGKTEVALKLAEKAGVYYVNFRDRLQEIMKSRTGSEIGPCTGDIKTREDVEDEEEEDDEEDDENKAAKDTGDETEDEDSGGKINSLLNKQNDTEEEMYGEDFDPNAEWLQQQKERKELEELALKSLGAGDSNIKLRLESFPMDSIPRVERKADEVAKNGKLSKNERAIKAFLQHGTQLPSAVLEEYIRPLWEEEPFKSKGFILVGFPNTARDVEYLVDINCWPEKVYIMECDKKTCRQRLMRKTLACCLERQRKLEKESKGKGSRSRKKSVNKDDLPNPCGILRPRTSHHEYMTLKLPSQEEVEANRGRGATTPLAKKISKALLHYHYITTRGLQSLKIALNRRRINWMSYKTDLSLLEAKNKLKKAITPSLRYRKNFFESLYILHPDQAEALLQGRYFHLSRFRRWCPVESWRGNTGINLWNAPGVQKYPVLYRNYIYFIAGEENLEMFLDNVIETSRQPTPTPVVPFHLVVVGPPKSGKTELCKRIARCLGFHYVSEVDVIERMVQHSEAMTKLSFDEPLEGPQVMTFATNVDIYLRSGHSVPRYMVYRSLDFFLLEPVAQHHGVVYDNYPTEDLSIQELLERGVVPGLIVNLELDLERALERVEKKRRIPNYNFEDFVEDCEELVKLQYEHYGPMNSPCLHWYGNEAQCLINLDGNENPAAVFKATRAKAVEAQLIKQKYMLNFIINSNNKDDMMNTSANVNNNNYNTNTGRRTTAPKV